MISQLLTAPNQLTLLRLIFVPFIVITIVDGSYGWALGLFVVAALSDGLDGLLARALHQKTTLGQYLDPIADKLLLSAMFLVLSTTHKIPWKFTVLVFSRDLSILATCAVLYATSALRDFRPSIFGKMNTGAQVGAIFFVLLNQVKPIASIHAAMVVLLWMVFALTLISGVHYALLAGQKVHGADRSRHTAAQ